ncbi:primosomal replication protein N [Flocculibacter collagenilyticus]|uniref:primosomal replication protein N n=1 Tax=Flocculibacter collagenilyticus TaxID=2744479 RepID=UPI0018F61365|nr:primosomal replication protein N [Flocculibacter collagenilyticus]
MDNWYVLTGTVCKTPMRSTSPAGIPHCKFVLEHQSQQLEAGMQRKAYLRMQVVVSGEASQHYTQALDVGSVLRVAGFLNRHESKQGNPLLVLHAQQIERLS